MSDNERPKKESKTMNNFFIKILSKTLKVGSLVRMAHESSSFRSSTITDIMVDTFKFTSKSKLRINFCAGYSIRKLPLHLSPDLYLRRAKGQVWGILLTVTNDQF